MAHQRSVLGVSDEERRIYSTFGALCINQCCTFVEASSIAMCNVVNVNIYLAIIQQVILMLSLIHISEPTRPY